MNLLASFFFSITITKVLNKLHKIISINFKHIYNISCGTYTKCLFLVFKFKHVPKDNNFQVPENARR